MKKQTTKTTNKPIHSHRIGAVSASVFLNPGKNGEDFPSAVIRRSYKTEAGFKDSSSYSAKQLNELAAMVIYLQHWFADNYPDAYGH